MKKSAYMRQSNALLFSAERYDNTDVECEVHLHPEMQIILVTEGVLDLLIEGKEYEITPGLGVFIPAFAPHKFYNRLPNKNLVMMFSKTLAPAFSAFLQTHLPICHTFTPSDISLALVDSILPLAQNAVDPVSAEAVVAPLCKDICQSALFKKGEPADQNCTLQILEYINAHFQEELTLQTVARAVGVHPVTVSKLFSKRTGTGFSTHLQYQRCAYGARLLLTRKDSITQIAFDCGFGSVRSFNRAFLSIYGKTPSQYRSEQWRIKLLD